ncbi:MAG TPA: condensation domain-containing protein, partial [Thermoanaerobaculia bacterium]|nr:condensation domain-containing protein [Thermoanaerobaculia bacterium]
GEEEGWPEGALDDLLYVIYTSGSTGLPKGASVYQRGYVNLLRWYVEELGLSAADRFLVVTSPGFDLTQKNFFAPLLCGGLLVLADPGLYDPREIVATIERHGITRLNCTPSAFYPLLEEAGVAGLSSLRSVCLGGEPIARARLAAWRHAGGVHAEVVNTYGPTECTDVVAFHWLSPSADIGSAPVPVGRPLPGFHLLVLDHHLSPAPIGASGQLAVGGVGVGAGHLGRADLTAEKFVPDPFAEVPGARLYRTGDLARALPGGEIDFLGRADHQVKLRGLRIELGEIETVLGQHPGVREAVVLARDDHPGDQRLVAYVTPAAEPGPTPAELQRFLAERLPGYMVPAAWVLLAELPLTANGKVDRRSLPAPEETGREERGYVAPQSSVEEVLVGIWEEVLRRERVGVEDDFFAVGGHSLLATQVTSRVRRVLGVELPLKIFFESPTIASLATAIERSRRGGEAAEAPPIPRVPPTAELPLSFAQQRLWFVDQLDLGNPAYNVPLFLRLVGPLAVPALWAALAEILCRHEALRSRFPTVRGVPAQEITEEVPCGWPLIDHGSLPPAATTVELARLELGEQSHRFRLERGPLLRALLVRRGGEEHAVLLTLHHIAFDGWSLAILARELEALYTAAVEHRPALLPELPVQYCDYAAWQRRRLRGPSLERLLAYWTGKLAALPPPLALPYDRPRPDWPGFRGAALPVALSPEAARSAHELARREVATLFVVLLAGFKVFLAAITGQNDLLVGSPVAGRTRTEFEPLIGMFMNTLVLRTDLAGDPTFAEIVRRVRTTALEAYDHQDLPFERLVDAVLPAREAGRPPLSQVWFVLQNQEAPSLSLPQLHTELLPLTPAFTKFDLALNLSEGPAGIEGQLEYPTDLFDEATARHLGSAFAHLLTRALAAPELRLAELAGAAATAFQAVQAERRRDFQRSLRSS